VSIRHESARSPGEGSLGDLVAIASRDVSLLLRQEVELAKAELKQTATSAGLGAAFLAVAGGLAFFAAFALTICLAEALHAAGLPRSVGYLIVGAAFLVIAGFLALFGLNRLKRVKPPKRTLQTVKDDVAWAKHPTVVPTAKVGSSA